MASHFLARSLAFWDAFVLFFFPAALIITRSTKASTQFSKE
jgi:hypothetical protein